MERKNSSNKSGDSTQSQVANNELNSLLSFLSDEVNNSLANNCTNNNFALPSSSREGSKAPTNHLTRAEDDLTTCKNGQESSEFSDSSHDVSAVSEDIDDILDYKAEKTNLSVVNVKTILKNVIMNQDVVDMVCKSLQGKEANIPYEPKLTRSKTRELRNTNQPFSTVFALPLTDVSPKPINPECQLLIDKELCDDSSDEEYMPGDELQSDYEEDEDNKTSSASTSTPHQHKVKKKKRHLCNKSSNSSTMLLDNSSRCTKTYEVEPIQDKANHMNDACGSKKISEDSTDRTETIGHRTRSKLSLSETPLEIIEQQFIPPDITCDMYDWNCDNEDWNNFLKEFTQPLDALPHLNETVDDVEADPEYNVLADEEEIADEDKEELRVDRAVQVSRKELNGLVKELFEYSELMSSIEKEKKDRQKIRSKNKRQLKKQKLEERKKAIRRKEEAEILNRRLMLDHNQRLLLQQQLRQHVQLTTQHYLQTYKHPVLHYLAAELKPHVVELHELGLSNPKSFFRVSNLKGAINIIERWEKMIEQDRGQHIIKFMEKEIEKSDNCLEKHVLRVCTFPQPLMKLISESDAFPYPLLLPCLPFYSYNLPEEFVPSEQQLAVLGISEFLPHVRENKTIFKISPPMNYVAELLSLHMMPIHSAMKILKYIKGQRISKIPNPIKEYFNKNKLPSLIHYIIPISENTLVKDQPEELLPHIWRDYLET